VPLTNVEIAPLDDGSPSERRAFIVLSVRHIVLAMPAAAQADEDRADLDGV
jgi:hypothetical protein